MFRLNRRNADPNRVFEYGKTSFLFLLALVALTSISNASSDESVLFAGFTRLDLVATLIFAGTGSAVGISYTCTKGIPFGLHRDFVIILCAFSSANLGGTIRDILCEQEVFWINNTFYMVAPILIGGISSRVHIKCHTRTKRKLEIADNMSTAIFASFGVMKVSYQLTPPDSSMFILDSVVVGTLTAVGGGVCRDICLRKMPSALVASYAGAAALFGSFIQAIVMKYAHLHDEIYGIPVWVVGFLTVFIILEWTRDKKPTSAFSL